MMSVTLEIDEKTVDGMKFLGFLETLGYVSVTSMEGSIKPNNHRKPKIYTALDFLDEWSGAFEHLDDEDADEVRYNYLSEKYK